CGVCTVIRHGFTGDGGRKGVCTTASSGRAHDALVGVARGVRAMLVCRVIAGKVKRVDEHAPPDEDGSYDSVCGITGSYSVSELGTEDSGRNIVEIIFKSSWQNKNHPIFTIDRILKVNNTRRTIQRFEDCRETVKLQATLASTATRRAADGNELLRFHCTTVTCSLGLNSSSTLCSSVPGCGVCTVIRHGFTGDGGRKGVLLISPDS
nr:zinc finger, C2H2, poly(ADP-ribose) polymerase, catalytic domain protein [Tanacetum cinerariifolium]